MSRRKPHPLGATREECVEAWRTRAAFGDPSDPITRIAILALKAAEATDRDKAAGLALEALGLHGNKRTADILERLRHALNELVIRHALAYPGPDDDQEADPAPLAEVLFEGAAVWLYARAMEGTPRDLDASEKGLRRLAGSDPRLSDGVKWALSLKASKTGSRGRAR